MQIVDLRELPERYGREMNKDMLMKMSPRTLAPMFLHKQDFIKISKKVAKQQQKEKLMQLHKI